MNYINLNSDSLGSGHICCAISDKKCAAGAAGYTLKKEWLRHEFDNGYVFRMLDERAKVFIEYGPAEKAWCPVMAPGYIMLGCFWVSGRYKGTGHGKALLRDVIDVAKKQGKSGLAAVTGEKKYHFMSDGKWLMKQGFRECDKTPSGFSLLYLPFDEAAPVPRFSDTARQGQSSEQNGYVVYYSNRCPFTEFHVTESLAETAMKRGLNVKVIKLETLEQAQAAPSPAVIFSLFKDGKFITTDISVCIDSRFDAIIEKAVLKQQ